MKKIGFFLLGMESQYEGVARPFINFAKGMQPSENVTVYFLCLKCGNDFLQHINSYGKVVSSGNINDLIKEAKDIDFDYILTDDDPSRLKYLSKIKRKTNIKTGVYVQILYGVHSIINIFDVSYLSTRDKLLYSAVRYIPFNLFSTRYTRLLKKNDIIISNSKITRSLLHLLYYVESDSLIYPPVDTQIFNQKSNEKENKILLYIGSNAGDTNIQFLKELCANISWYNYELLLFGNKRMEQLLTENLSGKVKYISGVSDNELALIYSKCKLVICPQKWEQFGYVPVESMACGTPVLAFDMMGPSETIVDGNTGWLAKNEEDFRNKISSILKGKCESFDKELMREHAHNLFSAETSARSLEDLIIGVTNGK